ncbi:PKD domain-containing protein [Actinoplanes sp. NPDC026623]|uniref:PKD domain-containing protein n=1 Tax=Actinoplanes sp. NPDC026623 TaxID=3155610 RepID=UPI0033F49406
MKKTLARLPVTLGVIVTAVAAVAGTAAAVAITPATGRTGTLVQIGPIAEHGFPAWYRDSNNVRLELCTDPGDLLCPAAADEMPHPDEPVSFPDNFPGESFYQLAGADFPIAGGARVTVGMNVEAAFAREDPIPGDQVVFGRVRIRFDAPTGQRFRITHPYGIDDIVAGDKGVNMTEDVGIAPGAFGGVLSSRIGPFLKWDPNAGAAAPAGYTGDPAVNHKVVGSPYDTNFVRVERLDPASGAVLSEVGFTDLFSVQGRLATNGGVDIDQATYTANPDGTGTVEVFASSETDQVIEIVGNQTLGFHNTRLRGSGGRYYGRFPLSGSVPRGTKIEVMNSSDRPVTRKSRELVDLVTVTGLAYDADAQTLAVSAASSDLKQPPAFSVAGFGPLTDAPFQNVVAPPAAITVTSSAGGSATVPVAGTGRPFLPSAPVAGPTADAAPVVGQTVRLDAAGSAGEIDGYTWTQTAGPAVTLSDPNGSTTTFVPTVADRYRFTLTVHGPGGDSVPAPVTVNVVVPAAPKAKPGPDQVVVRGRTVALDGSKSVGAETYSWRQVSGPPVTLINPTSAKPTFTFPVQALPAVPGPNKGFAYNNDAVELELTVKTPTGVDSSRIFIRPQPETLSGLSVRYRTNSNEWRISGTSSLLAGQRVAVVLGSTLTGQTIGAPVTVDGTGAFDLRVTGTNPGAVRTVSFVTTTGAQQLAFAVNVTN